MSIRTLILDTIARLADVDPDAIGEAWALAEFGPIDDPDDDGPWMVEIIYGLELAYDIAIEDDEAEGVWAKTVGDLVDLVERKVEG